MNHYFQIAHRLFRLKRIIDYWRYTVFIVRCLLLHTNLQKLIAFFSSDPLFQKFSETHTCIYEQATRQFLYRGSTPQERSALIMAHLRFCRDNLTLEGFEQIYFNGGLNVWSGEFQNEALTIQLLFNSSLKKEGLMIVALNLGGARLYHIDFWLAADGSGETTLSIGALQGIEEGLPVLGALAKDFFGYRPRNLVLRVVRLLAAQLHIDKIYAVSDNGHYTQNHFRLDRQLKTSLDKFWLETGGKPSADPRFFELDHIEPQKNIEDIKSSKRSQYRKRFALLDEFDAEINERLKNTINATSCNEGTI
jgi:uncharacterized protein VirK/YbjX